MPIVCIAMISCATPKKEATFSYFSYEGNDTRFEKSIDESKEYYNPILAGYYPDPSITKKGDTFYLVNSSFSYFPGVPIFESKDLVNWNQIGHVLDRDSQLNLEGLGVSEGIFAPAINYNPYNDTFYMITTLVGRGGNFYVKTKDPSQGWSDPIWLPEVDGIDPSFLFDEDGKAYIVHNAPVNGQAQYEGERSIRLLYFDVENDKIIGEPLEILRGGTHVRENPIWIEGPHLYHIGDWYYLMCAEGGTAEDHSEVILRSKSPEGPWEEYAENPILTQREGLPYVRPNKVTSTGHADIIKDNNDDWWAVFLGCLPYEGNLYNTGRNTFLLPVEWREGWPVILDKNKPVPTVVEKENLSPASNYLTGNFSYIDKFEGEALGPEWLYIRNPLPESHSLSSKGLTLKPSPGNIYQRDAQSTVFRRQQHTDFSAETELDYQPTTPQELAGIILFQNENYNFVMGKTIIDGEEVLVVKRKAGEGEEKLLASTPLAHKGRLKLKVDGKGGKYSFYYIPEGGEEWIPLIIDADGTNLSTEKAGGFVGTMIGLYSTDNN